MVSEHMQLGVGLGFTFPDMSHSKRINHPRLATLQQTSQPRMQRRLKMKDGIWRGWPGGMITVRTGENL